MAQTFDVQNWVKLVKVRNETIHISKVISGNYCWVIVAMAFDDDNKLHIYSCNQYEYPSLVLFTCLWSHTWIFLVMYGNNNNNKFSKFSIDAQTTTLIPGTMQNQFLYLHVWPWMMLKTLRCKVNQPKWMLVTPCITMLF